MGWRLQRLQGCRHHWSAAAGSNQRPGETRIDLLKRNTAIFDDIIQNIVKYNDHGIILVATNPVDILSYVTLKKSGFPVNRVIGSGTLLDSARFRYLIGQNKGINPRKDSRPYRRGTR